MKNNVLNKKPKFWFEQRNYNNYFILTTYTHTHTQVKEMENIMKSADIIFIFLCICIRGSFNLCLCSIIIFLEIFYSLVGL